MKIARWYIAIVTLLLLYIPELVSEIGLTEIVELVNFSRMVIEDGELNVIYFSSFPKSRLMSEKDAAQHAKVKFEKWKLEFEKNKEQLRIQSENDMLTVQDAALFFEDYVQYLVLGKPIYESQNIAFQVKHGATEIQPEDNLLYRICRTDRYTEYENAVLRNNRYLSKRMPLSVKYHEVMVVNHEYRITLGSSSHGVSVGTVEPKAPSYMEIPFNLMGRAYHPINVQGVITHGWENIEEHSYYAIEYKHPTPVDLSEIMSDVKRATIKIWLDPKLDFCVVQDAVYLYTTAGVRKMHEDYYTEFKKYSGGIWYPTRVEGISYSLDNPEIIDQRFFYLVREADFNIGMPLDFFDLNVKEVLSTGVNVIQ